MTKEEYKAIKSRLNDLLKYCDLPAAAAAGKALVMLEDHIAKFGFSKEPYEKE